MNDARPLPPRLLHEAAALIRRRSGIVVGSQREQDLERAMRDMMARRNAADPVVFLADLASSAPLLDDLVGAITVGETYFFRQPEQMELLRQAILPSLLDRRSPGQQLRLWSAGCASGEEAYTLAMIADELGALSDVSILGTDISRAALERARSARFGRWSLRVTDEALTSRYFRRAGRAFSLVDRCARAVEFRQLNLLEPIYPSSESGVWQMDVILCRNVFIYLDPAVIRDIASRLVASLSGDGWLLLGASDPMITEFVRCESVQTPAGIAYRREQATRTASSHASHPVAKRRPSIVDRDEYVVRSPNAAETTPPTLRAVTPRTRAQRTVNDIAGGTPTLEPPISAADCLRRRVPAVDRAGLERACLAALDRTPEDAGLHALHAFLLVEVRQYDAAVVAARRALYVDRRHPMGHLALGTALAGSGDRVASHRAFLAAARLLASLPANAVVPDSDGQTAAALHEFAAAETALSSAMRSV